MLLAEPEEPWELAEDAEEHLEGLQVQILSPAPAPAPALALGMSLAERHWPGLQPY